MGTQQQDYLFSDDISKECSAAIEELSRLESSSHSSLLSAYNQSYADTLRRRLVQAEEAYLSEKLVRELQQEKAHLGGTFYGWSDEWCQTASARDIDCYPLENIYSTLVSAQNHRVPLNNPEYAAQFFDSMLHSVSRPSSQASSRLNSSQTLQAEEEQLPVSRERLVGGSTNGRLRRGVVANSARPPRAASASTTDAAFTTPASALSLSGSRPVGLPSHSWATAGVASETDLHPPSALSTRLNQSAESLNANRSRRQAHGRTARIVLPSSQRSSSSNLTIENNIDLLVSSRRIQRQQVALASGNNVTTTSSTSTAVTDNNNNTVNVQVAQTTQTPRIENDVIVQDLNTNVGGGEEEEDDGVDGDYDDDDDEDTLYSPTPRHARSRSLNTNYQNATTLLSSFPNSVNAHRHTRSTTARPTSYYHFTSQRPAVGSRSHTSRPSRPRMVRPSLFLSAPRKTTSQLRLEKELAEKEAKLRAELATKFRANPVPSTSLVPKYSQIMKTGMTRAAEARAKVIHEMRSKRKPVAFLTWNTPSSEEKPKRKPRMMSPEREQEVDNLTMTITETLRQISLEYEAKHGETTTIQEDQTTSVTPSTVKPSVVKEAVVPQVALTAAEDGRRKRRVIEEQERRSGLTDSHTFRPNINPTIPDFEKLQQDFELKLNSNKGKKPKIKIAPFPGLEKHQIDMEMKPKKEPEPTIQKTFTSNRPITSTIPPATEVKSTKTFELKKQAIEEKAKKEAFEKEMQSRMEIEQKIRQLKIAVKIRNKIGSPATSPTSNTGGSPRKSSAANKEYQRMLHEMKYRLEERPLIFERQNNKDAEQKKKTVFDAIINDAGLNHLFSD